MSADIVGMILTALAAAFVLGVVVVPASIRFIRKAELANSKDSVWRDQYEALEDQNRTTRNKVDEDRRLLRISHEDEVRRLKLETVEVERKANLAYADLERAKNHEIEDVQDECHNAIAQKDREIDDIQHEFELYRRQEKLNIAEALKDLKNEIAQKLAQSDVEREVAKARLEAYEKVDTKTDHEQILKMFETAIEGLANNKPDIHIIGGRNASSPNA